jgi:hypothetical protein
MLIPRLRLRVRTLVLLVAVAAVSIRGSQMYRRWVCLRERAAFYADVEKKCRFGFLYPNGKMYIPAQPRAADEAAEKRRRCELAAWRPWQAIPSDLIESRPSGAIYSSPR